MNEMKFCPKCGLETLLWDNKNKWSCSSCSFVLFHNVAGAVAVLITCGDEMMFTRRNQDPAKGKLDLSGGFTDPEESAEHTCARELHEELGLEIEENQLQYLGSQPNIYPYKNIIYNTIDLFFRYDVAEKFQVTLEKKEVSEIVWIRKKEISLEDIAFESQRKFLAEYCKIQK